MRKIQNLKFWGQIEVICIVLSVFLVSAYISPYRMVRPEQKLTIGVIALWIITIGLLGYCVYLHGKTKKMNICASISRHKVFAAVIVFAGAVRILMIMGRRIQCGDGAEYYTGVMDACGRSVISVGSLWKNLSIAGHLCQGFAFFEAIGEYLIPRSGIGVLLIHLLLTLLALYCIYDMLQHLWVQMSEVEAALGVLLTSVIPVFMANFTSINPDYYIPIFFIYVMYFDYRKYYILSTCSVGILALTKETAWVLIAGYFAFSILKVLFEEKVSIRQRLLKIFKDYHMIVGLIAGIPGAFYLLFMGGSGWVEKLQERYVIAKEHDYYMYLFAFDKEYIQEKSIHFFVINFMWLISIICLASVLLLFIRRRKNQKDSITLWNIFPLFGGILFFTAGSFLYIAATIYRYALGYAIGIVIITIVMYWMAMGYNHRRSTVIVYSVITCLFFIQSFLSIDPLSEVSYWKLDTGRWPMLQTIKQTIYNDSIMANYQYTWMERALDQMMSDSQYDEDTQIIKAGTEQYYSSLDGNERYDIVWNKIKKRRQNTSHEQTVLDMNTMKINTVKTTDLFSYLPYNTIDYDKSNALMNKAIIFFFPFFEEDIDETMQNLSRYYYIGEQQKISEIGGSLIYYQLWKKENIQGILITDVMDENIDPQMGDIVMIQQKIDALMDESYLQRLLAQIDGYPWGLRGAREEEQKLPIEYGKLVKGVFTAQIEGKVLDYHYFGTYGREDRQLPKMDVAVGSGCYVGDLEQELVGKKIGDTIETKWIIEEDGSCLSPYKGKEITVTFTPVSIEGDYNFKVYDEVELQEKIGKVASAIETEKNQIINKYIYANILQNKDQMLYTSDELQKKEKEVRAYLNEYEDATGVDIKSMNKVESEKEYESVINRLARMLLWKEKKEL